ncbi:uncharacterized protein Z518_00476 [Rhinocladiella mackenziei CBS 650.93]|uniref:Uncharacterized protein n=1 Tax=Rhinocladiella mackenziei CBS 650.93 TaxID=1442369 RepID=A0A0D2G416_9EURO|nr:uncharacterized protein Z518_00476 [Rhinocladiella mackenziei CBS 650.93]KIX09397.1 hypothetical protein Z518_00476 [Rhinocladiella mackenziei CBS 650.93]
MEMGFEIILCSVTEAELRYTGAVATSKIKNAFAAYKALSQRFFGIGGGRVVIDFDNFVITHRWGELNGKSLRALRSELDGIVTNYASGLRQDRLAGSH